MPKKAPQISMFNTHIAENAINRVAETLQSTFISEGKLVREFENKLSSQLGLINPLALNSGTSALHLAVVLAGLKEGDEVICPAQTFIATALAIIQEKAKPVFADIQYETGNIDPKKIEEKITERTKALMVVHWGGYPCDMDELQAIAKKHNLIIIEDAAHAPGASYKERPIGSISPFTCFSFQAIKHITTGDGGALCCLDPIQAKSALKRRWFGIDRELDKVNELGERDYNVGSIGFKYHMNDYAAALGLANLEDFDSRLARKREVALKYRQAFGRVHGINLFKCEADRTHAFWLFGMHVERRDLFIRAMASRDITCSVAHTRIDRNSVFGGLTPGLVNQERFDSTQIHVPIHDGLSDEDVSRIIESVEQGW